MTLKTEISINGICLCSMFSSRQILLLMESTTLSVPTFVKGKYSGATAFRSNVSDSTSISVYEKTGASW